MNIVQSIKRGSVALALGFVMAATLVPADAAFAGNISDTDYSSYATSRGVSCTDAREKWDYTSSWDACYSGANHTTEVAATPATWSVKFVGSPIYGWWAGKSGYLVNYVREAGYPKALLWFNNTNSYGTTITGVWSPDSV